MILDNEALQSEREQLVELLSALEAKLAQIETLEARLEQTEQEKRAHSQEATQLHDELAELKVKCAKLQDTITSAAEHESASMERIGNLEANLHSNIEEATLAEEKRAKIEEKLQNMMEQNHEHTKTNCDMAGIYNI